MWHAGTRIVAAVSGGSDSVAMLLLLHELHTRGELQLDAIAHLNHSIRQDADQDEAFCRALADRLGTSFVASRVDVPALSRQNRQSIEMAARTARRTFLEAVRCARGADRIATAHTEDDQAETVMLRLLRGAGRRGAAGIAPRRGRFIRPLLCATREELQHELERRGHSWREDVTNADLANPRNRVRHELMPFVERHFNPSARHALSRFADLARADEAYLAREAAAATVRILEVEPGRVRLDREALNVLPEALARRVVQNALDTIRPHVSPALRHVDAVREMAEQSRSSHEIPGLRVEHSGRYVVLVDKGQPRAVPRPFRYDLEVPGEIWLPEAGVVVRAEGPVPRAQLQVPRVQGSPAGSTVQVAADGLGRILVVRSRRPGDELRPLGLGGRKKLQDVLVDRKVSRDDRDKVPIVTDAHGRIVWVGGHVIGEEVRVTDDTNAVIILKLRRK
jgi:tRNA(Ile)-lysidine synthase